MNYLRKNVRQVLARATTSLGVVTALPESMEPTPKSLPVTPKSTKTQQQQVHLQNSSEINSVDSLTVENLATLKRAFELHDDRDVHIDNLHVVLNSLGVVPSGPELTKMKEELLVHANSNGTIHFQKVIATIDRHLNEGFTLPESQVLDAFKLFDKQGTGIIEVSLLKPFLLTLGKLTEDEVNEMIAVADPQNTGKIRYYAFVKTLFQ